jgi:CheY-like chemotaxis protein
VESIFDSFTQAGTDTARKFGGTGLGLTISKQLATLMGGDISVESEVGSGTVFSVTIPLTTGKTATADGRHGQSETLDTQALQKARILLVEDNEFNRMVAEDTLQELAPGVSIEVAVNGREAVDKISQNRYDIVLMDIQMPVMDGLSATKMIRKELPAPARDVKIIAMTANVLQEDVQLYLDAGMNAYVSKPFKPEELVEKMMTLLPDAGAAPAEKTDANPPAAPLLPEVVTDRAFLRQFTGGKTEKMDKYIGMFLENAPRLLRNIDEAYAAADLSALRIAAHSLKPQLTYMGVKEELSHIFLIEQTAGEAGHSARLPALIENLHRVCTKAFEELRQPA